MDRDLYEKAKHALLEARELAGNARREYLEKLDEPLRAEVQSLLAASDSPPPILHRGLAPENLRGNAVATQPEHVGPYRVIRVLGEGGMGTVYLAEQREPVKRQVAIKVVRRGLDSRRVIARFEGERQALALMDHPYIPRLFEAGDDAGAPYFVMEPVDGVPITTFCDREALSVPDRIRLFLKVCEAVQHAHQKGVIHRDLKPTNILIVGTPANATPRVIDFGIAKALDVSLAGETLTHAGQLVGTPDYMSPEQAGAIKVPVDTRSDVYALGVVLYEMLCGARPHQTTGDALETMRALRDTDPPRPSTRVEQATSRLRRQLSGDLDNIVLHALRREPERRYPSVEAFADDLRRHLAGRPVLARPDTIGYRTAKFVRRNRAAVVVAAVLVLAVVGYLVTLNVNAARLEAERNRAVEAEQAARREAAASKAISDFLVQLFELSNPSETRGNTVTVREILDRGAARIRTELSGEPELQGRLLHTMGDAYYSLGLYGESKALLDSALAVREAALGPEHPDVATTLTRIAYLFHDQGRFETSLEYSRRALEIRKKAFGAHSAEYAGSLNDVGVTLQAQGKLDEAEPMYREALAVHRETLPANDPQVAWDASTLAQLLHARGDYAGAESLLREALAIQRDSLGTVHYDVGHVLNNLGGVLLDEGRLEESEAAFNEAFDVYYRLFGEEHAAVARARVNRGLPLRELGRLDEAQQTMLEGIAGYRRMLGPDHPFVARALFRLAECWRDENRYADAERSLREAIVILLKRRGEEHRETERCRLLLGAVRGDRGDLAESLALIEPNGDALETELGPSHPAMDDVWVERAVLAMREKDYSRAAELARRAEGVCSHLPEGHWRRLEVASILGAAIAAGGDPSNGLPILEKAERGLTEVMGSGHRLTLRSARWRTMVARS